jgi:hypothetical protein
MTAMLNKSAAATAARGGMRNYCANDFVATFIANFGRELHGAPNRQAKILKYMFGKLIGSRSELDQCSAELIPCSAELMALFGRINSLFAG